MDAVPCCPVCAQDLRPGGSVCPNRWCRRADRGFSVVFSVGRLEGALRTALHRYKYRGERGLAPVFGSMLAGYLRSRPCWFEEFDLITAVPGYTGPGRDRPWDPVAEMVGRAAEVLGPHWPVDPGLLLKTAATPRLAGRTWSERQSVARGPLRRALRLGPGRDVAGVRVLVVDDVLTEGSTLRETARLLRRCGADEVAGLVLARPAWGPDR